jgi:hypothetical protein
MNHAWGMMDPKAYTWPASEVNPQLAAARA